MSAPALPPEPVPRDGGPPHLTWVEVRRDAIAANLRAFRARVGPRRLIMAVVKANAYGHGMVPVARAALEAGADALGVNSLEEALALRDAGVDARILTLGHANPALLPEAVARGVEFVVYDPAALEHAAAAAAACGRDAAVHLKVETGLHRQGLLEAAWPAFRDRLRSLPRVRLAGVSTHYANIEDTLEHGYARMQTARYEAWLARLAADGFAGFLRHAACSAGAILFDDSRFDMVRAGIGLYGLWPSRETRISALSDGGAPFALAPALSWFARVAQVKEVPAGSHVGYGGAGFVTTHSRVAVIPVGYYEGYDRALSGRGHVYARGKRCPVLGRVCMNMTLLDVTHVPDLAVGDPVTLLGGPEGARIPAEELAGIIGTINYEVVTRIHERIPRLLV